jgi:hypothetical protein
MTRKRASDRLVGQRATKGNQQQRKEKTGPSALPKLILQIILEWISKGCVMVLISQMN